MRLWRASGFARDLPELQVTGLPWVCHGPHVDAEPALTVQQIFRTATSFAPASHHAYGHGSYCRNHICTPFKMGSSRTEDNVGCSGCLCPRDKNSTERSSDVGCRSSFMVQWSGRRHSFVHHPKYPPWELQGARRERPTGAQPLTPSRS